MKRLPRSILDASALLAYVKQERGVQAVRQAIHKGAGISAANWAEVLAKLADTGQDPDEVFKDLTERSVIGEAVSVLPVDEKTARESAKLRKSTREAGLSTGDRICLATGRRFRLPVVTADRTWTTLKLGVDVICIR